VTQTLPNRVAAADGSESESAPGPASKSESESLRYNESTRRATGLVTSLGVSDSDNGDHDRRTGHSDSDGFSDYVQVTKQPQPIDLRRHRDVPELIRRRINSAGPGTPRT
jgi:hypothetical protein